MTQYCEQSIGSDIGTDCITCHTNCVRMQCISLFLCFDCSTYENRTVPIILVMVDPHENTTFILRSVPPPLSHITATPGYLLPHIMWCMACSYIHDLQRRMRSYVSGALIAHFFIIVHAEHAVYWAV